MNCPSKTFAALALLPLFWLPTRLPAAQPTPGTPAAAQLAAVHQRMQTFVDSHTMAGAVTLVADRNRVLYLDATGYSDLAGKIPMREDQLFWIASMTKPITAVAIMILRDEGRLEIDDPVEKYLPEFKAQWLIEEKSGDHQKLVRPARPITIKDLLTHTSGLGDVAPPRPDCSLAELVMAYSQVPLKFPPGSKWEYCNSGINTLGRLVEVISGQSFAKFLQQRITNPLAMNDTTFWPSARQAKRLAKSYKVTGDALEETSIYFLKGGLSDRNRTPLPAGGLFSTAANMARFYQMMLNGGALAGRRVLSSESAALMTKTQSGDLTTGFTEGMSWGLGFQVVRQPKGVTSMLSPGTFGHGGAYATQSWADPNQDVILILMLQRAGFPNGDNSPVRQAFQEAAVGAFGASR